MKLYYCLHCNKELNWIRQNANKYCNNKCQKTHESNQKIKNWLEKGKDWSNQIPAWAKRHLVETRGYNCEICGIDKHNKQSIVLECDHIDGNYLNNKPTNLRLVCPNCHSQTATYKAKNKGHGRKHRKAI